MYKNFSLEPAIKLSRNGEGCEDFPVEFEHNYSGTFKIVIDNVIQEAAQFRQAVKVLELADENNPVVIYLQSPGGNLGATDALIHAMRKCRGHIHIVATGNCSSAATLILLEAHSFELSEYFSALLHCGSTGSYGNFNEYDAQAKFDAQFMPRVIRQSYEGFLSEDEITDMLRGADIWLDAEGWCERWQKRNEYLAMKERDEEEDELSEEEQEAVDKFLAEMYNQLETSEEPVKRPKTKKQKT